MGRDYHTGAPVHRVRQGSTAFSSTTLQLRGCTTTSVRAPGSGLLVRSERAWTGPGRFYIAILKVKDETNNVAIHSCVLAVVPHAKNNLSLGNALAAAADALVSAALMVDGFEALDPSILGLFEHGLSAPVGPRQ